jgi:diguanylate cyclase (GGDEF)-like protein
VSKHSGRILYPTAYSGGELTVTNSGKLSDTEIKLDNQIFLNKSLTVPISNAELDVTVLVNNDEINKKYNNIVFLFFLVVGLSLVVIGTFAYFASSRMTRSIMDLSTYVAQMGADCDGIPEKFTKRSDEAGRLANSFSLLLSRLNSALDETDYIARHDSLTLLSNRYSLENDISELIREHQTFAFALLDVDDFKVINDSKGHDEGDRLLKDLASVFRTFRPDELATYRWGGDEFALIIFGNQMDQYERILKQIMERVDSYFRDAGDSRITVSIGVCAYPESAVTYKNLLINADKALAFAKMSGKVNFCFYRQ